jgi:imidazolonepropionase-like amidohydrolase
MWGIGGRSRLALACAFLAGCAVPSPPETPPPEDRAPVEDLGGFLLQGGTVMTAAGPTQEQADVWIRGTEIRAIGSNLPLPEGARVIDLGGRWVTPGIIDPHSHLGVYGLPSVAAHRDGNEASSPFTPGVRADESFWPQDPAIGRALASGVTTIHVLPGSANLVGGQGVTVRLKPALSARAMRFPDAPLTMKMACGENPKRVHGDGKGKPKTRMGEVAMLRQSLEDARSYTPPREKAVDFDKAALAAVLNGEILIQNHCYRADEMLLRLELFAEFGIRPRAFHHAVEAYKIRTELAEAGVGAVVWADRWGDKMELLDAVPANAAMLDSAGVRVALHSDSPRDIQRLNQWAGLAMAAGRRAGIDVTRDHAIRWITANPAWVLGIEDQTGTLELGKDADIVVWSGDPFSVYTRSDLVFVAGDLVYDRAHPPIQPLSDFELGIRREP